MNKTQAIFDQYIGTHVSIMKCKKTAKCACNSTPIVDIYVLCCVDAVGREFKFPLDDEISAAPNLERMANTK